MTLALQRPMARPVRARAAARPLAGAVPVRRSTAVKRAATPKPVSWEVRSFVVITSAIACVFIVAVLYLMQTTAVSTGGYAMQRLADQRDELRRQNSLLEVQIAKLDSPTRIETDARQLGLTRAKVVPIVSAETLAVRR